MAIPHVVVDGENDFDILVVRSLEGIDFGQETDPVHVVFALVGSRDERNFHLQCHMAIAQIIKNTDFLKNWSRAHDVDDLRNIILLAERIRKAAL